MKAPFFDKITKSFIIIGILAVLVCFPSCSSTTFDHFGYTETPFETTVEGVFGDLEVKSDIYCDFSVRKDDVEEERILTVAKIILPEALEGATVTVYNSGRVSVRLGELEAPSADFAGLGELYLLLCPEGEPYSIERIESEGQEGVLVVFSDDTRELSYFFKDNESFPVYIRGVYRGRAVDIKLDGARYVQE